MEGSAAVAVSEKSQMDATESKPALEDSIHKDDQVDAKADDDGIEKEKSSLLVDTIVSKTKQGEDDALLDEELVEGKESQSVIPKVSQDEQTMSAMALDSHGEGNQLGKTPEPWQNNDSQKQLELQNQLMREHQESQQSNLGFRLYGGNKPSQHEASGVALSSLAGPVSQVQMSATDPGEGLDHYKKLFSFTQRKVEFENFRFKHPSLLAVVIESISTKVIDRQRIIGKFFFRFHVSDDLNIGELQEIMKFKINAKIQESSERLTQKERIVFFNQRISVGESSDIQTLYNKYREDDGWLYLDFLIEEIDN